MVACGGKESRSFCCRRSGPLWATLGESMTDRTAAGQTGHESVTVPLPTTDRSLGRRPESRPAEEKNARTRVERPARRRQA